VCKELDVLNFASLLVENQSKLLLGKYFDVKKITNRLDKHHSYRKDHRKLNSVYEFEDTICDQMNKQGYVKDEAVKGLDGIEVSLSSCHVMKDYILAHNGSNNKKLKYVEKPITKNLLFPDEKICTAEVMYE
jgi:hypothetical protein